MVVIGNANLDPLDGDGRREAIAELLAHARLQDPRPSSPRGAEMAAEQGGTNAQHKGDPAFDTADWRDEGGPGNLRVSYVLPDRQLAVRDAGVAWHLGTEASGTDRPLRHGLVWVDVDLGASSAGGT